MQTSTEIILKDPYASQWLKVSLSFALERNIDLAILEAEELVTALKLHRKEPGPFISFPF